MNIRNLFSWLKSLSPFVYNATKCGHQTKRVGSVSAFEQTTKTKMPKNEQGSVDYCLDCIGNMAIQCAWCKSPIFIGDPVTLYTPKDSFEVPEHAVVHNNEPLQLVGCLRWNCAQTGADRAGFWLPNPNIKGEGFVKRTLSPIEMILAEDTPSTVIISDLSDPNEKPTVIPQNKNN